MKLKHLLSLLTASICNCRSRVSKGSGMRFSANRLDKLPLPKLRASSSGAQSAQSLLGDNQSKLATGSLDIKGLAFLDLSSGAPESDTPEVLKQAAAQAIMNGANQYGESHGDLELRRLYAGRLTEQMSATRNLTGVSSASALADAACAIDPDTQVTVLNGTSSALAAVLLSTVNAGDEVLVFAPYFEGYLQAIAMAEARAVPVPLGNPPSTGFAAFPLAPAAFNWSVDETALRAAITPATRAIIINSPHNPTGRVFTASELSIIAAVAREHDLLVIADEIYNLLTYQVESAEAPVHLSIRALPGMAERSVVIDGLSKTHSASGWRIGFVTAPVTITRQLRRIAAALGLAAPTPLVVASRLAYLPATDPRGKALADVLSANRQELERNGRVLADALRRHGFALCQPEGATYILAGLPGRSGEFDDLAQFLLDRCRIKVAPGAAFFDGDEGRLWVRFCFARRPEIIDQAVERLALI